MPQPEEGACYARRITREDGRVGPAVDMLDRYSPVISTSGHCRGGCKANCEWRLLPCHAPALTQHKTGQKRDSPGHGSSIDLGHRRDFGETRQGSDIAAA